MVWSIPVFSVEAGGGGGGSLKKREEGYHPGWKCPEGRNSAIGVDWPQYRMFNHYIRRTAKRAACTACARARFSKIYVICIRRTCTKPQKPNYVS